MIKRLVRLVSYAFTSFSNHHNEFLHMLKSGILCFYIILKLRSNSFHSHQSLVSYAFTSFSNFVFTDYIWRKCLVSYAFTSFSNRLTRSMELVGSLVSYAFTSFSNCLDKLHQFHCCLVSYAFTSFSNNFFIPIIIAQVWYLMLLHHSQTLH